MIPTRFNRLGLPPFRRVAYLESTGTQYIDMGIAPDFAGGDSIRISFHKADYPSYAPCVFGSREAGAKNGVYLLGNGLTVSDADGYSSVIFQITTGDYVMSISDTAVTFDGTDYAMPRRVTCGLPLFVFALNNDGTGVYGIYSGMRLYDWKYYRNGKLAQHLVPVLDKSGVPCLFDEVTRTFEYNAGTGVFNYA